MDFKKKATHILAHIGEFYQYAKFNEEPKELVNRLENSLSKAFATQENNMIIKLKEPFRTNFNYPNIQGIIEIPNVINPEGDISLFDKTIRYLFLNSPQSIVNNKEVLNQTINRETLIGLTNVIKIHKSGDYFINNRLFTSPYIGGEIEEYNKKGQLLIEKKPLKQILPYIVNNFQ